jgi:RNA polymerase sigma factor for flagellar operon FliA
MRGEPHNIVTLWMAYRQERAERLRNRLIEHYLPLVDMHAMKLLKGLGNFVELDDIKSAGTLGLIEAVERFDPSRNATFKTFSGLRIRGAILDELRGRDRLPRTMRAKVRQWSDAVDRLTAVLGCSPTDEEVATALNVGPLRCREVREAASVSVLSLEQSAGWADDDGHDGDKLGFLQDHDEPDPADVAATSDHAGFLFKALGGRERWAIVLRHVHGQTYGQIATQMGTSPFHATRMIRQAHETMLEHHARAA